MSEKALKQRQWRTNHRDEHRKSVKNWKAENRSKLLDQKRRHYQKNRASILEKRKKRRQELKEEMERTFGTSCIFCNRVKKGRIRIHLHEIHGKKHTPSRSYILAHKEEFRALCTTCHHGVHWLMRVFGLTWEEIVGLKSGN